MKGNWVFTAACMMLVLGACSKQPGAGTAEGSVNWPLRSIELVCGGSAGGDTDFNARAFVEPLTRALGQSVVVINMPGGGTSVATDFVHDADSDGYTILINHNAVLCLAATGSIGYGLEGFEMIGIVAASPGDVLLVNSRSGIKTIDDLLAAARNKPGSLSLSLNAGANTYVEGVAFSRLADVQFNIVDGGTGAEKCTALLGGHIDVTILAYGTAKPYIESGDFNALAVFMPERSSRIPDVPTLIEKGINVSFPMYYMLLAPKGTPVEITGKIYGEVEKIVQTDANYAVTIETAYGQTPFCMNARDAEAFFASIKPLVETYIK